jgi:hypothetical protein
MDKKLKMETLHKEKTLTEYFIKKIKGCIAPQFGLPSCLVFLLIDKK